MATLSVNSQLVNVSNGETINLPSQSGLSPTWFGIVTITWNSRLGWIPLTLAININALLQAINIPAPDTEGYYLKVVNSNYTLATGGGSDTTVTLVQATDDIQLSQGNNLVIWDVTGGDATVTLPATSGLALGTVCKFITSDTPAGPNSVSIQVEDTLTDSFMVANSPISYDSSSNIYIYEFTYMGDPESRFGTNIWVDKDFLFS